MENTELADIKQHKKNLYLGLALLTAGVIVLALIGFLFLKPGPEIVQGQAEATSVRVSGRLPGRIVEFYVTEGDSVAAGDTLVHIHSSVAEAQLFSAESVRQAQQAVSRQVDNGARSQVIQAAYDTWQTAVAARDLAEKTYNRIQSLFSQGAMPAQRRDEAKAAYDAASAQANAAKSQYELLKSGATAEERESSRAMAQAAEGNVMAVEALLEDQYLVAPCSGVIDVIYPNEGELVMLGAPVMNVLKTDDKWVTFNVKEELLKDLPMGKEITVMIPALGERKVKAEIYYIRDLGSYAVWSSTKQTGQWDSRTFRIKARPVEKIDALRPGMSIIYLADE